MCNNSKSCLYKYCDPHTDYNSYYKNHYYCTHYNCKYEYYCFKCNTYHNCSKVKYHHSPCNGYKYGYCKYCDYYYNYYRYYRYYL